MQKRGRRRQSLVTTWLRSRSHRAAPANRSHNRKPGAAIVDGARAEVIALHLDDATIDDVVLVGTVSPQHMYGFESTVLLALHGPCAFAAEHPLHPDEVVAVLSRISGRRVLITAPVHLRALAESAHSMPMLDRVVSATAPLTSELAKRCESMWGTRVFEVYGCTETGMVATRRTVDGALWTTMRDVKIESSGDGFRAHGGHVQPGQLADRLRLISASTFELEGRTDDVVNIGGKRASLQGLNRVLLSIDGVVDGAIFEPPSAPAVTREQRLMALVVAPDITRAELLAALRAQIDPAFLPRPLLWVDALPRNSQGKLPKAELLALAKKALQGSLAGQSQSKGVVPNHGRSIGLFALNDRPSDRWWAFSEPRARHRECRSSDARRPLSRSSDRARRVAVGMGRCRGEAAACWRQENRAR